MHHHDTIITVRRTSASTIGIRNIDIGMIERIGTNTGVYIAAEICGKGFGMPSLDVGSW